MKKGKVDALLGIVFGDEGKGKVVDVFTPNYDVVARFAGGPNAGHTIIFDGKKFVLRSIPSGIFAKDKVNIIGNGCVIAPDLFMAEAKELETAGYDLKERLHISKRAHLILPTHRVLDRAYEAAKGKAKVGTTGKGIGPTYSDKAARIGLRVGDILDHFDEKYAALKARHEQILRDLHYTDYDIAEEEKLWLEGVKYMRGFHLTDTEIEINRYLKEGKSVLAEGAQGTMLDIDHGTYPFVSSSSTTSGGVCTGLGVGPTDIGEVFGIFKAYSTRVGSGPFPVELFDQTGDTLREVGHEYGAVTGRNRRCGWVDLVALKYAIMINGVTQLIMMKSDVLDGFDTIKACVAYKKDGVVMEDMPFETEGCEAVTRISHRLSHQGRGDGHGLLKFILLQRQIHRLLLDLMKFLRHPVQHAEGFDELEVLEGLLVEDGTVAGHVLIFSLKILHLPGRIPGSKERDRSTHQRDQSHPGIVLHHDDKRSAEADQRRHHIGQKGQDRVRHRPRISIYPIQQIAGAVLGQRFPVGPQHLLINIRPDLIGHLQPDFQRQTGLHFFDNYLGLALSQVFDGHPHVLQ